MKENNMTKDQLAQHRAECQAIARAKWQRARAEGARPRVIEAMGDWLAGFAGGAPRPRAKKEAKPW